MHEEDHPALELLPPKPSKLNHLVAPLRKEWNLHSKTVSVSDSVPQWNESRAIEFDPYLPADS
jgi:hypothetical protein